CKQRTQFLAGADKVGRGERTYASDTNNTQCRTPGTPCKAHHETPGRESGSEAGPGRQARGERGRTSRAGAVQAVQASLGGDRRPHAERPGHAFYLPVLSEVAPCSWSGAWV